MNILEIRKNFPILNKKIKEHSLVYLDNAATTQKPLQVINALSSYYCDYNAAIHRGVHYLSNVATAAYENARENVRAFINAKHQEEIVFVRGTTEAINLVAATFGRANLKAGDEVLISTMEHHSNIVPWQMIVEQTGATLKVIAIDDNGDIDLDDYARQLNTHTKIVAVTHVSNVLGTINPVKKMIKMAHDIGVPVLIDGAQAIARMPVDVQDLDCDFYAFSGHKIYSPMGIGVLYGKKELLQKMPPYHGGGGMIRTVTFAKTEYADLPAKFEAGTQNVAGAIGLNAAINYLKTIGMSNIFQHELQLLNYAQEKLSAVVQLKIIGNSLTKTGVISFVLDNIHPHDVATILDTDGIAVRAGHHCAMPLMERYQVPATTRVSFGLYNTIEEIDVLLQGLDKVLKVFA